MKYETNVLGKTYVANFVRYFLVVRICRMLYSVSGMFCVHVILRVWASFFPCWAQAKNFCNGFTGI